MLNRNAISTQNIQGIECRKKTENGIIIQNHAVENFLKCKNKQKQTRVNI